MRTFTVSAFTAITMLLTACGSTPPVVPTGPVVPEKPVTTPLFVTQQIGWGSVFDTRMGRDGSVFLTAGGRGVHLFSTTTGKPLMNLHDGQRVWTADINPANTLVVTGNDAGAVKVWDLKTQTSTLLASLGSAIDDIMFDPDGKTVWVATRAGLLTHLVTRPGPSGSQLSSVQLPANPTYSRLEVSPDGQTVLYDTGSVRVFSRDLVFRGSIASAGPLTRRLWFTPDSQRLIVQETQQFKVFDVDTLQPTVMLEATTQDRAAMRNDGQLLVFTPSRTCWHSTPSRPSPKWLPLPSLSLQRPSREVPCG